MKGRKYVTATRRVVTEEQIEQMNELRWGEKKLLLKEIADQTGLSAPTVCRYTGANWRLSFGKGKAHGKRRET